METEVLIIGAGLAGLSAGYHMSGRDHVIVEADQKVGGLCKSFQIDGFHFDCTGHLIHFRTPEGRKIVQDLMGSGLQEHQRKAAIYIGGRFTDYPFQANTYGLPPEMIKECLLGFVESLHKHKKARISNFYDWVHDIFGSGIAKHFMVPYNEKLWQHDLRDIALDWVNWSIPKPSLEEVLNGALGLQNRQFGYNPVFYYPAVGGIGQLPESFPVRGTLLLDSPVKSINLKRRTVRLKNDRKIRYRYLFSTMPLHAFLGIVEALPATISRHREKLQYVSVLNINLGIDREHVIPYHWVYFPEREKPFYRMGCTSNFSSGVAPAGTSSLYVEVSLRPDQIHLAEQKVNESIQALKECGILRSEDKVVSRLPIVLQYAYVVYNRERQKALASIHQYLKKKNVFSFGRYGSWVYSSMEDAILQGREYAQKIQ